MDDLNGSDDVYFSNTTFLIIFNLLILPLILLHDIGGLRYWNLFGFISIMYTTFVLIFDSYNYHEYYCEKKHD